MTKKTDEEPDFTPTTRARRARMEDVLRLERAVAVLTEQVATMVERLDRTKPDDHGLPMSREMFMAHCLIATIQSGGWSNLKFADSRAREAYDKWVTICAQGNREPHVAV